MIEVSITSNESYWQLEISWEKHQINPIQKHFTKYLTSILKNSQGHKKQVKTEKLLSARWYPGLDYETVKRYVEIWWNHGKVYSLVGSNVIMS